MSRQPSDAHDAFSFDSRTNLTAIRERFDWWWVLVGVGVIVAGNLLAYLVLRALIERLVAERGQVLTGAAVLAGVALAVYFGGGVLVGRMSKGHTVREPAVAAVVALAVVFLLQLLVGMFNLVGLVVGAPLCFGVAYLGGILGEKWQDRAQGR
jgi:hypothetical protein